MTLAVHPLGERIPIRMWFKRTGMYALSIILSGAFFGFLFTDVFFLLGVLLPDPVKVSLLSGLVLLYALHELRFLKLKIPQRRWQIPGSWVSRRNGMDMVVWGVILGAGIFTYIPHSSFYILYLFLGFFLNPLYGILLGALYGFSRMIPSLILGIVPYVTRYNRSLDLALSRTVTDLSRGLNFVVLAITFFYLIFQL
ncbi:hypothetical protein C8P63_103193 [Melghirimyces profundicolus]|uniref:Uncharacterized protein n=1 Tax=Melghirimyces profundicolus TaxID=1242148 RepID=A0A2T6C7W4_9BACL|nr:hypothetical protein [Melghirimyces profundicolus]PTX64407.1 hypothetical protein C8P63_103193 [Melghirimyces profundicolus]